ncbi:hypothetical protein ACI65C_004279 [Semiaphis heraclei]
MVVPIALPSGAYVLLLLFVVLVLATLLTAFIVKLAVSCSPVCSDTDDEVLEFESHSSVLNDDARKPNSRRLNANDTQPIDANDY